MSQLGRRRNAAVNGRDGVSVKSAPPTFQATHRRSNDVGFHEFSRRKKWKEAGYTSYDTDFWNSDELDQKDDHGLTATQIEAFREVFNLFDINGGGTIDATELDSALQTVDIHLSHAEIVDVLQVIDEDGNGEIDFEEFLTLMTSTERFLENLRGGSPKEQGKENVLFSALAKFMKKSALSSLSEIERYYNSKVRKSPHVVGHYAAGARLIGLTEKQMAKHLATLSSVNEGENNDSPYAQPLCMFQTSVPSSKMLTKRKGNGKIRLRIITKKDSNSGNDDENNGEMPNNTRLGAQVGSDCPANSNQTPSNDSADDPPVSKPKLNRPKTPMRLRPTTVPLPAVSMRGVQRKNQSVLTIEDLPCIRSKVQMANELYRKRQNVLRVEVAQTCAFTDVSSIKSRSLQKQFKSILEAYSFKPTNVPSFLTPSDSFLRPYLFSSM